MAMHSQQEDVGGRESLVLWAVQLAYTLNNHTETVLIKVLLGPLALIFYWLTLTS